MSEKIHQIRIGTAQLGSNYGVSNKNGKIHAINFKEMTNVIETYTSTKIDTAIDYNNAPTVIGQIRSGCDVTSKINTQTLVCDDYRDIIKEHLNQLGCKKLKHLLIHDPHTVLKSNMSENCKIINERALKLIQEGFVEKFGASLNSTSDIKVLDCIDSITALQVPFNFFDRRFVQPIISKKINLGNIFIQVRSIFLQGLLVQNSSERHKYFDQWKRAFDLFNMSAKNAKLTKVQYAIAFVLSYNFYDEIIVGVSSVQEVCELLDFVKTVNIEKFHAPEIESMSVEILEPRKWKL